jgi:hypothetical protein
MPKFDISNPSTIHKSLVDKSKQVQEAFCKAANAASDKGMNITLSVKQGLQAAEEVLARELLAKQEELLKQQQVNKAEEALRISLEKQKALQEQQHRLALNKALENLSDDEDEEDLEEISKVLLQQPKAVKSTEFDKQGRLVTIFEDGTRVISKNAAPADKIDQTVAVQINPVFDYVRFNTTADTPLHEEGLVFYDDQDHSLCYYNEDSGITLNIGREELVRVYNNNGETLVDGDVVYINGAIQGWPTVKKANAGTKATSSSTLGVVTAPIPVGDYGYVCVSGVVHDLDTSAYTEGTVLYLNTTSGKLTNIPPLQPNYVVEIGTVLSSHLTEGKIYVRVDKRPWAPSVVITDSSANITLPTVPTIFKAGVVDYNDGFNYDPLTGELEVLNSASYGISMLFNAIPSASNKAMYFYAEEKKAGGNWEIIKYSARKLELINAQETQLTITTNRYYPVGSKIRFNIWGDATITLRSSDLPGTVAGTVVLPAYRFLMA